MICLYGYSFSCFIPIFLLCIIPVQVLQWLLIAYGMINTSVFLIFNLKAYLSELEPPKVYLTFGLIVGAQVALFLTFKLVFFKMVYEEVPVWLLLTYSFNLNSKLIWNKTYLIAICKNIIKWWSFGLCGGSAANSILLGYLPENT